MTKQKRNPKRSVAIAAVFALLAVVAFAAVFWIYDGMSVVEDLLGISSTQANNGGTTAPGKTPGSSDSTSSAEATDTAGADDDGENGAEDDSDSDGNGGGTGAAAGGLDLPEGMSEEFALRLWQEQIDSQPSIGRLVNGDVEKIVVTDVLHGQDESRLSVTAYLASGGSADGFVSMRRVGGNWFFANLSGVGGEKPNTVSELPALSAVDVDIINAMIEEQLKSADILEEYASGDVEEITFEDAVDGPGTKTLNIVMNETHEEGYGGVILVSKEINGKTVWFITRFTKQ